MNVKTHLKGGSTEPEPIEDEPEGERLQNHRRISMNVKTHLKAGSDPEQVEAEPEG